jgi:hypothetical protein
MRQHFLQKLGTDWKLAAIVGLSKNAGKTTFLNWIVSKFADKKIGIITTGRDGEDNDLVGGHKKPKVLVPAGSFFSTGEKVIKREANSIKIITKLPYIAGGQRLWLVQATEQIYSEIIGPATAFDQVELAKKIISLGANHVFIDGSLDRKSIALSDEIDALILVAGASGGDLNYINKEISRIALLADFPKIKIPIEDYTKISYKLDNKIFTTELDSILNQEKRILEIADIDEAEWIYFPKAFTSINYEKLHSALKKVKFIFYHPLHIQLKYNQLERIVTKTFVLSKIKIDAIVLNSYSVKGNHLDCELLRSEIRNRFSEIPVIDITEI